jgi:hypothetical protein
MPAAASTITTVKLAQSTAVDVRTETRVHIRALLTDALRALTAVDNDDYSSADSALKAAMMAAGDGRAALQIALAPPSPKAQVDASLKDWL